MKISLSNRKLGSGVASISRPVGPTCPQTCPFLANGCYAERMETFRPTVAQSWRKGMTIDPVELAAELVKLIRSGKVKALRIHVGGDVLNEHGNLDRPYLAGLLRALRRVKDAGCRLPAWIYTHAWNELAPFKALLNRLGVETFASVHTSAGADKARRLGYRLAVDGAERYKGKTLPVRSGDGLTCPEQRKGVPCSDCGYCFRARPGALRDVVFYRH